MEYEVPLNVVDFTFSLKKNTICVSFVLSFFPSALVKCKILLPVYVYSYYFIFFIHIFQLAFEINVYSHAYLRAARRLTEFACPGSRRHARSRGNRLLKFKTESTLEYSDQCLHLSLGLRFSHVFPFLRLRHPWLYFVLLRFFFVFRF